METRHCDHCGESCQEWWKIGYGYANPVYCDDCKDRIEKAEPLAHFRAVCVINEEGEQVINE